MNPIGFMKTPFKFKNGTPRQPTVCSYARGSLTIEKSVFNNPEHSLEGLEEFSHVWILFLFHKNNNAYSKAKVKPPRLNGKKVGLFSTRCPYRPNNIGLSLAKIESVIGATVNVSGVDILDGTPVLDIKPYIPQYDCPSLWISAGSVDSENDGISADELVYMKDETVMESNGVIIATSENEPQTSIMVTKQEQTLDRIDLSSKPLSEREEYVSNSEKKINANTAFENAVHVDGIETVKEKSGSLKTDRVVDSDLFCDTDTTMLRYDECSNFHDKIDQTNGRATEQRATPVNHIDGSFSQNTWTFRDRVDVDETSLRDCSADTGSFPDCRLIQSAAELNIASESCNFKTATDLLVTETGTVSQTADWICKPSVEKLLVRFTHVADQQLDMFSENSQDDLYRLKYLERSQARKAITSIIQEDPRSTYRRKKCIDSLYYFTVDCLHVTCWFDENIAEVVRVKPAALVEHCRSEYV